MLPLYRSPKCTAELLRNVILGGVSHSRQHGIEWLVFLVSPGLARLLEKLEVPMEACGPEVEHRGTRRAYRAHIENGIASVPWAKRLNGGRKGYQLFSTHAEGLAQAAA